MEGEGSSKVAQAVIQTLKTRGWCIEDDNNQLKALIVIQTALSDDVNDASAIVNSVESELLNTDIKSVGAKSLPDLNKSSYLHGPKILQDISVSSTEIFSDPSNRRLLKFTLTDGHNEMTAIEYYHIPSIPNDVVPGTKVRLENKVPVESGMLCLNPKVITILGGVVQPLYEEWKMKQKYLTLSRSSIRSSQEMEGDGPPQFEKLQIGAPFRRSSQHAVLVQSGPGCDQAVSQKHLQDKCDANQNARGPKYKQEDKREEPQVFTLARKMDISQSTCASNVDAGSGEIRPMDALRSADDPDNTVTATSLPENVEQKPSSTSDTRLKEAEMVPVQNQAAAQKLLQKMGKPNQIDQYSKGRRYKVKGKEAEQQVFTLDEWEKKKTGVRNDLPDVSHDENLAWELQNQLDMEDSYDHQIQMRTHNDKLTDDIRMSMFSYERDADRFNGTERGRGGRGRGRGRGKGRGRGRGRGRHY